MSFSIHLRPPIVKDHRVTWIDRSFKVWMGAYSTDTGQIPTSSHPVILQFVVIVFGIEGPHHRVVKGWSWVYAWAAR